MKSKLTFWEIESTSQLIIDGIKAASLFYLFRQQLPSIYTTSVTHLPSEEILNCKGNMTVSFRATPTTWLIAFVALSALFVVSAEIVEINRKSLRDGTNRDLSGGKGSSEDYDYWFDYDEDTTPKYSKYSKTSTGKGKGKGKGIKKTSKKKSKKSSKKSSKQQQACRVVEPELYNSVRSFFFVLYGIDDEATNEEIEEAAGALVIAYNRIAPETIEMDVANLFFDEEGCPPLTSYDSGDDRDEEQSRRLQSLPFRSFNAIIEAAGRSSGSGSEFTLGNQITAGGGRRRLVTSKSKGKGKGGKGSKSSKSIPICDVSTIARLCLCSELFGTIQTSSRIL